MNEIKTGRILKGIGGFYYVDTDIGIVTCRARGKLRKLGETPYVGDSVNISVHNDMTGYILEINERKNVMIRPPIANIDMIAIIVSKAPPCTDTYFIDRIAAMATKKGIEVCIVINKCDEDIGQELFDIYNSTGISVFRVSAKNKEGLDEFKAHLAGKLTALTGNSGVGKSTLINAVLPSVTLQTGEINEKIGRGRHTTRQVEILKASEDMWIADTPGFSAFDITAKEEITKENLKTLFPDFFEFENDCQYIGCSHINTSGCAVIDAVNRGDIRASRYESYKKMFSEIEETPKYKR
ncbi:MAG: ribosome small subunit-dependent GTPase A [Oscillospiraceae bacterium]|nr:ribosome small subunit-dependent GTPase A [Oscillospiraceae bacterium]